MERFGSTSHRGFSVRSIFTFVLAVVITALLWVIIGGQASHAADPTAAWSGDSIVYNNHTYNKATDFKDATNTVPAGSTVYQTTPQTVDGSSSKKVFILYFSSGVDPPTATTVKYVEFDISSDNATSNPQNARDVTLEKKGTQGEGSSCSVQGIGWIICPLSVFIAQGMDNLFKDVLAPMMAAQPSVLGDPNNSMYIAWNIMRNIANLAFVIVFLIIIYSQLTNYGVSNYGLKKLIPRLIIAAILVNVSFIIAAAAIDISNILGYSIQTTFTNIRESVFHLTNDDVSGLNSSPWTSVTAAVLAGGGVVGGVFYLASAGLWVLVPLLIGLISVLILVIVVLAARQAIIVILVIIAPLAFVANLLPNTEKWFDKWKDLFFSMLIFFPAFALVFGGSQLAGQIIIQNADGNIVMLIFGLAVQIAPLAITPLLLKFSGGILGKITQIANNPKKGIMDRSRNWAKDRSELTKQKTLAGERMKASPFNWGAGMVRSSDFRKRRLQDRTGAYKQLADNRYHESEKYEKIHEKMHGAELDKQRIENQHTAHLQNKMSDHGSKLNIKTVELENAKASAERAQAQTAEMLSGYRAGAYDTAGNARLADMQRKMAENVIETAAWKQGEQNNNYVQQRNSSDRMRSDTRLLDIAQGYGTPELQQIGRERAQAAAVSTLTKLNADARQNVITLMETEAVEAKKSVKDYAIQDIFRNAASDDPAKRQAISKTRLEAALEIAAADGQVTVFDDARANQYVDQDLVDAVVARHVGDMKSKGGFHIQASPRLSLQRYIEDFNAGDTSKGTTEAEVRNAFIVDQKRARLDTLGNTASTSLAGVKYGAFQRLAEDMVNPDVDLLSVMQPGPDGRYSKNDLDTAQKIFDSLREGLSDPNIRGTMTDRLAFARDMEEAVRKKFFPGEPPLLTPEEQASPEPPSDDDYNI
jgi:hypothetical protein